MKNEERKLETAENKIEKQTKCILNLEWVIGVLATLFLTTIILIVPFMNAPTWVRVVLIVFGFVVFVVGIYFCLLIEKIAGYYECPHCKNKYVPTYSQVLWSMHFGRTRHMKCPKCEKRGWNKKVVK